MTGGTYRQALARGSWFAWPPALIWIAALFALSSISFASSRIEVAMADKVAHAAAYGALGLLLAFARLPGRADGWGRVMLVTGLVTVCGVLTEWHQTTLPDRHASAGDVAADALGGFLAAAAVCVYRRRAERKNG